LNKQSGVWPGTLALVHQYIKHKTSKFYDVYMAWLSLSGGSTMFFAGLSSNANKMSIFLLTLHIQKHMVSGSNYNLYYTLFLIKNNYTYSVFS